MSARKLLNVCALGDEEPAESLQAIMVSTVFWIDILSQEKPRITDESRGVAHTSEPTGPGRVTGHYLNSLLERRTRSQRGGHGFKSSQLHNRNPL